MDLPVGVVEGHRVDDIRVLVERKQFLARVGVPHLARAVIAARDELAAALVEGAVGERKQVGSQDFEEPEALHLVLLLLFDELFNELLELRFAGLGDQGLLQENLVDQSVNVRPVKEEQSHELEQMQREFELGDLVQKVGEICQKFLQPDVHHIRALICCYESYKNFPCSGMGLEQCLPLVLLLTRVSD